MARALTFASNSRPALSLWPTWRNTIIKSVKIHMSTHILGRLDKDSTLIQVHNRIYNHILRREEPRFHSKEVLLKSLRKALVIISWTSQSDRSLQRRNLTQRNRSRRNNQETIIGRRLRTITTKTKKMACSFCRIPVNVKMFPGKSIRSLNIVGSISHHSRCCRELSQSGSRKQWNQWSTLKWVNKTATTTNRPSSKLRAAFTNWLRLWVIRKASRGWALPPLTHL